MEKGIDGQVDERADEQVDESIDEGKGGDPASDLPPQERFAEAEEAFSALMERDFPDFSVEEYADEKAVAEGIEKETFTAKFWDAVKSVPDQLDVGGDGKFGLDDAQMVIKQAASKTSDGVTQAWEAVTSIEKDDVSQALSSAHEAAAEAAAKASKGMARFGRKISGFDYTDAFKRAARGAKESAQNIDGDTFRSAGRTFTKLGRTATGIQGLRNRKEAKEIKEISAEYIDAAEALTDHYRVQLHDHIDDFGALRLEALRDTLGRFLKILKALKQNNRAKEYELLDGLGIDTETLDSMGTLDMTVKESLAATAATGALGVAAVMGTPALVTATVGALATASTGTAISSLSGAAASNAILAWLGGGSIAAGGGGMAAGGMVLAGITAGATAGVTLLAAGLLISTHYARKLTEAKTYQKDVALAVANLQNAWLVMDAIGVRVDELSAVTEALRDRLVPLLDELEVLVPVFDAANEEDAALFNKTGQLVKTMVELAQVPLLGEDGDLTDESLTATVRIKKILNTEL